MQDRQGNGNRNRSQAAGGRCAGVYVSDALQNVGKRKSYRVGDGDLDVRVGDGSKTAKIRRTGNGAREGHCNVRPGIAIGHGISARWRTGIAACIATRPALRAIVIRADPGKIEAIGRRR